VLQAVRETCRKLTMKNGTDFENNFFSEGIFSHASLFSGIGGFDLAAQWMGWGNIFQVEINKFCQKVLENNFPDTKRYSDIKNFNGTKYENKIDILTGGFPCQPFSIAGKRKGADDNRYLWNEMLRVIKEVKPKFIVGENVFGIVNMELGRIRTSLENSGYKCETFTLPACGKNAPHKRERVWILAYTDRFGCDTINEEARKNTPYKNGNGEIQISKWKNEQCRIGESGISSLSAYTSKKRLQRRQYEKEKGLQGKFGRPDRKPPIPDWRNFPTSPALCGRVDGVSDRVDRIKALGNAIVPQIAFEVFCLLEAWEKNYFQNHSSRKTVYEKQM